ncbi:MAG: N-acetyltransferase [Candidatus Latescibacteria bacterium]|nr:N-acetyltransferase [Candidatus Latescibacterota bacterium]
MHEGVFIHLTSEVSPQARVGAGTKIWQRCTVLAGAEIGEGCLLSQNVYVEGRTRVGNNVKIKNNVSIFECVELEDDVFVGPSAVFTNVMTPRSHWPRKEAFLRTLVRKGATIGANATVVCGVTVGRYVLVGAGSVVTRDVPDFALVYGVPARQHGWACHCGERLERVETGVTSRCDLCGSTYELRQEGLKEVKLCFKSDH